MNLLHENSAVGTLRLPTPEGIALALGVATASDRAAALLVDLLWIALLLLGVMLVWATALSIADGYLAAFAMVAFFAIRVFYFVWHETRPRGSTPGKRRLRLRVVRADGGPLTVEAVLARNLLREVEFFLPLMFLLSTDSFWPGHPGWARLLAGAWMLMLLLFPLCNRGRLRLGDLIAGTRVVVMPQAALLHDLSYRGANREAAAAPSEVAFTAAHLSVYGSYELQVLEEVLRKAAMPGGREAVQQVCERIQRRIGWKAHGPALAPLRFLEAFYRAQRRHLEQQLLFGRRKERKDARP